MAILIPANQHRLYFAGIARTSEMDSVFSSLFPRSPDGQSFEFIVYYTQSWEEPLKLALKDQEVFSGCRHFYQRDATSWQWHRSLPADIYLARIEQAILTNSQFTNRESLLEEICSESPSLEHFLQNNFGFCAHNRQTLVGWCLAEYHDQHRYELGIETIEAYQRRGVATQLASAVIDQAFTQGAQSIGWHCWANNFASIATAKKLGFVKVLEYPVSFCRYQPG